MKNKLTMIMVLICSFSMSAFSLTDAQVNDCQKNSAISKRILNLENISDKAKAVLRSDLYEKFSDKLQAKVSAATNCDEMMDQVVESAQKLDSALDAVQSAINQ